jgi:hypothetical protein
MKTATEIRNNMAQAYGSEGFTRHPLCRHLVSTDGVQQLANDAECFWLIDAIASYRRLEEFQLWELFVDVENQSAVLTMQEDSDKPELVRQEIEYTSFPLQSVKFYVELGSIDGQNPIYVLMLPTER